MSMFGGRQAKQDNSYDRATNMKTQIAPDKDASPGDRGDRGRSATRDSLVKGFGGNPARKPETTRDRLKTGIVARKRVGNPSLSTDDELRKKGEEEAKHPSRKAEGGAGSGGGTHATATNGTSKSVGGGGGGGGAAGPAGPQEQTSHHPAAEGPSMSAADVASQGFTGMSREIPYRKEMEKSFGVNFEGVKAYTDDNARAATKDLSAHAYTMGNEIAFKNASPDKAMVAHELTHVLQQCGENGPCKKSDDGSIDTSGEHEAERVEQAVREGKPAKDGLEQAARMSAGTAGPAFKKISGVGPARGTDGGTPGPFGMGTSVTSKGELKKSYEYKLAKLPNISVPIFAGINFIVKPSLKLKGTGAINIFSEEHRGDMSATVGVEGAVGIGVSGGIPNVAELYVTGNPTVFGGATINKTKDSWNADVEINLKLKGKVGLSIGGGALDLAYEMFSIDILKLIGVKYDSAEGGDFSAMKFKWGDDIKKAWAALESAYERAKKLGAAAWSGVKKGAGAVADATVRGGKALGNAAVSGGKYVAQTAEQIWAYATDW